MIGIVRDRYPMNRYLYDHPDAIASWVNDLLKRNDVDQESVINIEVENMKYQRENYKLFTVYFRKRQTITVQDFEDAKALLRDEVADLITNGSFLDIGGRIQNYFGLDVKYYTERGIKNYEKR